MSAARDDVANAAANRWLLRRACRRRRVADDNDDGDVVFMMVPASLFYNFICGRNLLIPRLSVFVVVVVVVVVVPFSVDCRLSTVDDLIFKILIFMFVIRDSGSRQAGLLHFYRRKCTIPM